MQDMMNKQICLGRKPAGTPVAEDWILREGPLTKEGGGVLARILYLSIDPAMQAWLTVNQPPMRPVQVGEVMRSGGLARIVESDRPDLRPGDTVQGLVNAQSWQRSDGRHYRKVAPGLAPLSHHLGPLGQPGMTAYFGLLETGRLQPGETLVVSSAAGQVGHLAVQIGKIHGCRVVGIAGGPEKGAVLREQCGVDHVIDYKRGDLRAALREACPDGIDVFFDNVGGDTLNAALEQLAPRGRVVICGAVDRFFSGSTDIPRVAYLNLLRTRGTMQGLVVYDFMPRYPEAIATMAGWLQEGRLRPLEHIRDGLESFPALLEDLFRGTHYGKLLVRVADS